MTDGLHTLDWLILIAYAGATLLLGWFYGGRQRSREEYFIGSGRMNPLLVGVSLFATLVSTVSYLSAPGESLGKGPAYLILVLGLPIAYAVVAFGLLPLYMRKRVTSAYELLEDRLGIGVRLLGASMFVVLRLAWMSLLVYTAARAMTVMLGVSPSAILVIVVVTTLVAITYTSLGGLRAVVVTDCFQSILLLSGALLVLATVTVALDGLAWFPTQWQSNWDVQPLWSSDPATRITIVGSLLSMVVWHVSTAGGDQTSVQRFMATENVRAARRAYASQMVTAAIVTITLAMVGFALLGYFEAFPDRLPESWSLRENADDIFPYFIAHHLPVGVAGLVVAAMFAAAMSSIDSGVNSISAVVLTDFVDRFTSTSRSDRQDIRLARWLAFAVGAMVVAGTTVMHLIPGNITEVTSKTSNLLTTPIFCLFFFALFVPFARPLGVYVGTACGIATAAVIAFSGPILGYDPNTGADPISFQWIAPASLLVDIATGTAVSWLVSRRQAPPYPPTPSPRARARVRARLTKEKRP